MTTIQLHGSSETPDAASVVLKATRRAASSLGLTLAELGEIVGTRREAFSRPNTKLDSKQTELALLVVRVARSLSALNSGDRANMTHWMTTPNLHLGGTPKLLMTQITGLARVAQYLDALRGKL